MIPFHVLVQLAAAVVTLQIGVVLLLVVRNAWVERALSRGARDSRLLASVLHDLGGERSAHVRSALSRRTLRNDLRALERWIDLVVERGDDPGWLPAEEYERSGLVDRYLEELRSAKKWARRAAAAEILGWTGSPRAVPQLLATALDVGGESASVRAVALRSLGRVHHPDAVVPLVGALATADSWFAPTAAAVLAGIGAPSVAALRRELQGTDRPIGSRRWAATILGDIADRRALGALHAALADVDPELRARAAKALGAIRDSSSVGPLHDRLLTDPSPFVRTSVAKALGRLPTRETVEFLAQSLSDPEWWVRLRAVESLANLGSPAIDALRGALHDRDPVVAREAARGLEQLGTVALAIDALAEESYSPESTEFLIQVGRAGSLDALIEALGRPELRIVREVARVLGRIGNSAAGAALAALLTRTTDDALRARAIDALAKVGAKGHVRDVLPYLRAEHAWLRHTSLAYLQRYAQPADLAGVRDLLVDADERIRWSALRLLRHVRPENAMDAEVATRLDDPEAEVRVEAAALLAAWGRVDLLLAYRPLLDDDAVGSEVIRALDASGGVAAVRVVLAVQPMSPARDLDRLARIVLAVARERPRETSDAIEADLRDPAARWALATAALVVPGPLPISIEDLADDEDPRVRAAALPALPFLAQDSAAAAAHLRAATRDRSSLVARAAIRALALVPDPTIETQLEAVLRSSEPVVVVDALLSLALRRRLAARHIDLASYHDDRRVALAAAAGRAFQGDLDAILAWLEILRDPASREIFQRWRAGENPLFTLMLRMAQDLRAPLEVRLLAAESSHAMEMLLIEELESNPAAEARLLAAKGLERLASRKADGVLLSACLRDPSPRVRSASLAYLVERGGALQRLSLLEGALKDPEESVRVAAARRIATLEPSMSMPILIRHLGTSSPLFFQALIEALAFASGENPTAVARAILSAPHTPRSLLGLVAVLARVRTAPPADALDTLVRHRWSVVRAAAIRSLVPKLGPAGAGIVLQATTDPAADVRFQAARHLRGRPFSFDGLVERDEAVLRLLGDPSIRVRRRAALVAGMIGLESARSPLRRLAKDTDAEIARAARRAILRLDRRDRERVRA